MVIVLEDIDVLAILTHMCPENKTIYFLKPKKGNSPQSVYTGNSFDELYLNCKQHILFIHAFTGCDTTSAFYGKGKKDFAKICASSIEIQQAANIFKEKMQKIDTLLAVGVKCILALYGARSSDNLHELRHLKYMQGISGGKPVDLATLPPTIDAAKEHLKRVYLQIQTWMGEKLNALEWGWSIIDDILEPTTMNNSCAPESILKMIFCKCKKGCSITSRCGCRTNGLKCTIACHHCKGEFCSNKTSVEIGNVSSSS